MKFKKFTAEMLDKVNLFVLREIGRVIGVKAPAAKNKDDLIKEIIAVQNGELAPTPPSNLGAPQKTKVDLSAFLETGDDAEYPFELANNLERSAFGVGKLGDSLAGSGILDEEADNRSDEDTQQDASANLGHY